MAFQRRGTKCKHEHACKGSHLRRHLRRHIRRSNCTRASVGCGSLSLLMFRRNRNQAISLGVNSSSLTMTLHTPQIVLMPDFDRLVMRGSLLPEASRIASIHPISLAVTGVQKSR